MAKGYVVLNTNELSTLCLCVMNAPVHSSTEQREHLKLHAKLLKLKHQLELEDVAKKHRKKQSND